jgi:hypothetical protein
MVDFLDDPLGPEPLSPAAIPPPSEVFQAWRRAQEQVDRLTRDIPPAPSVLRTTGFLGPDLAEQIVAWFTGRPTASADAVRRSYGALARETSWLSAVILDAEAAGGLGVRVSHVRGRSDPYPGAAELCAEVREHGSMTIASEAPHPVLGGVEGGVFDQLRVVHDVFCHAALGLGFDLQSEFAAWLQCRTLFSADARGAAFCELVGAPTTYSLTGEKPALRGDLPPAELVAALAGAA